MTIVQIIGAAGSCGWLAYAARTLIKSRRQPPPAPQPARPPSGEAGELLTSWPAAVILQCGCCITYHDGGDARLAPCQPHARHVSWRLWEHQMGSNR